MRARAAPLVVAAVTVLALVGGACSSDDDDSASPTTTIPPAPTTTPTTQPADPYAIPAVIDEAYVNRVLAALNAVRGDAVRRLVSKGTIGFETVERLRAIYNDPEYDVALQALRDQRTRGLEAFKTPPGDRITRVTRVMAARADCILALAKLDFSQVIDNPQLPAPEEVQAITLRPTQAEADPKDLNPTPWSISFEEVLPNGMIDRSRECA